MTRHNAPVTTERATRDALELDEQLCFALHAASRAVTARYRPLLAELDLTYPQYLVMLVLWEGAPVTVGELGQRLQLDSGTLSPLLTRLERRGLVERRRRPEDERSVAVSPTARGRRLRDVAERVPGQMADAMGLTPGELASLRDALRAMADRMRAPGS